MPTVVIRLSEVQTVCVDTVLTITVNNPYSRLLLYQKLVYFTVFEGQVAGGLSLYIASAVRHSNFLCSEKCGAADLRVTIL